MRLSFVVVVAAATSFTVGAALAKLPSPTDEEKAKTTEAASKAAWTDKVGGYQLCRSMDRVATTYRARAVGTGKAASAPEQTPTCTDPGPYVPPQTPASSKPLEASGAHSPPGMATSPPSNKATSAEQTGPRK